MTTLSKPNFQRRITTVEKWIESYEHLVKKVKFQSYIRLENLIHDTQIRELNETIMRTQKELRARDARLIFYSRLFVLSLLLNLLLALGVLILA